MLFSSYEIDAPIPQSPEDFPDCGYPAFFNEQDFYDYVDGLSERDGGSLNYIGITANFNVDFDPPLDDGTISMSSGKCYVVDFETMAVSYAGYFAEYTEIVYDNGESSTVWCEYTAEDGATASPKTGNIGGHINIMLAAAGLALLTKFAKK